MTDCEQIMGCGYCFFATQSHWSVYRMKLLKKINYGRVASDISADYDYDSAVVCQALKHYQVLTEMNLSSNRC